MAYRHYVLLLLLLVYIHCLLSRMLPAFLVSVPTPGCDDVCTSTRTAPLCYRRGGWAEEDSERFLRCQQCRARVGIYAEEALADGNWFNMRDGACIAHWQYGILMGYGFALPFVLGSLITARLVDTVDRRCILAAAVAVWSGASAIMAGVSSFELLLFSRFLLGAAESFVVPASFSLIADYFEEHSQGFAGSLLSSGVCLGAGAASWAVPLALDVGWRASCLVVGAVGALLATLLAATVREPPKRKAKAREVSRAEVRVYAVWVLTAASSVRLAASYTIAAFLPIYYLRTGLPGFLPDTYATANASLVAAGGLLSALIGGIAVDHLGDRLESAPSVIAAGASLAAMLLYAGVFRARTFGASLAFYGCALLAGECWYGLMLVQVKRAVPHAVQGQTITLVLSVATIVSNAGPAVAGVLDPGDAALGRVLAGIVVLGTGLAAALFLLAAGLLESRPRGAAPALLLEGAPAAPPEGAPSEDESPSPHFSVMALSREVSLQLRRQVSISAPGHAEVVPPGSPSGREGAARPEWHGRQRSWSG